MRDITLPTKSKRAFLMLFFCAMLLSICIPRSVHAYVPSAPYLRSVKMAATSAARIEWDSVSGATAYQVFCRVNGGPYKWVRTTTNNAIVHKKLQGGSVYYYRVRALNGYTRGKFSRALHLCTLSRAKPSLTVSVNGTQAVVRWKAIKYASGYAVYRKTSYGYKRVKSTKQLYYKSTSLDLYTRYSFIVRPYRVQDGKRFYGIANSIAAVTAKTGYLTDMMKLSGDHTDYSGTLFYMNNHSYTHGFALYSNFTTRSTSCKLHAKYTSLSLTVGIEDTDYLWVNSATIYIYGDGILLKSIRLSDSTKPKTYKINVTDVVDLKFSVSVEGEACIGFADLILAH